MNDYLIFYHENYQKTMRRGYFQNSIQKQASAKDISSLTLVLF